MNTQATERFLMKRDFAHDTSPGLKTPSYLHSLAPETFDPDYESQSKRGVGSRASFSPHPSHRSRRRRHRAHAKRVR